jgi:hypothetical protein
VISSDHLVFPKINFSNHPAVFPKSLFAVSASTHSTISSYSSNCSGRSSSSPTGRWSSPPGLCRSAWTRRGRV